MKRKSRTPKNRWYCRYFMFKQAQATWNLDNVEDLTDEQYVQCLDAVHQLLTDHVPQRKAWKLQPNEGPEDASERDTPKALYSGEPMRYKNYSYRLLCYFVEKQQPGATPLSCSERVFEDALQQTSEGCHSLFPRPSASGSLPRPTVLCRARQCCEAGLRPVSDAAWRTPTQHLQRR